MLAPIRQRLLGSLAALFLFVPGAALADTAESRALDADGSLSEAQLLERVQILLMGDRTPPKPAAQGAIAAAFGQVSFSLVSGGLGAGLDLVQPADNSLHPDSSEVRTVEEKD